MKFPIAVPSNEKPNFLHPRNRSLQPSSRVAVHLEFECFLKH